jgi:uncharacterized repeat protein (TIGR01451 family)
MVDWQTILLPPVEANNGHVMRDKFFEGEFIWKDAGGDHYTEGTDPDTNYDLIELRITADTVNLFFLLHLVDITNPNLPYVGIAVDADPYGPGVADSDWEWGIVVNSLLTGYYDASLAWTSAGSSNINPATDLVEISMPLTGLGIDMSGGAVVRFTVFIGEHDGSGGLQMHGGHGILDAVTTADHTSKEINANDTVIDYYFDVYFERDGDPTSPLQISEVFYDPVSVTDTDEIFNEYVELYNPAQYLAYLDGKILGDEPDDDAPQDWDANFQFPGTPLTGTTYIVQPGEYVVVAVEAIEYDSDPPRPDEGIPAFPDHHWADWEFFHGLPGEYNNPDVPDLTRVYGLDTGHQFAIGNVGDNIILADGTTTTHVLSYTFALSHTLIDGMNYAHWGGYSANWPDTAPADTGVADSDVPDGDPVNREGFSLQRDYTRENPDTNNSAIDFEPDRLPTPGFARWLIDHAIYMRGPEVITAGQAFEYYLYYQIAGYNAPNATITNVLPHGVAYVSHLGNSPIAVDASNHPTITFGLGNIKAGTIGKITVTARPDNDIVTGTVLYQKASIGSQSNIFEGIADNDSAILSTTVRAYGLAVAKKVETATDAVSFGDIVTYTVALVNVDDADARDVVMTDTLPPGVTFGGWIDRGSATLPPPADTIFWGPWDIPGGQKTDFSFTATVTQSARILGFRITNTIEYMSANLGGGSDDAVFTVGRRIFLPLVMRNG